MTAGSKVVDSGTLRRRGVGVLASFAVLWALVAASGLTGPLAVLVRVGAFVVAAGILGLGLSSRRRVQERVRRQPPDWYRRVGRVNLTQFVVIAGIVVACVALDLPQLAAPLIALVVGVHFLPLATLFDQPQYRWTGIGLLLGGVAGLLVLAVGSAVASDEDVQAVARVVVGAVAAATLWGTALWLALRG